VKLFDSSNLYNIKNLSQEIKTKIDRP